MSSIVNISVVTPHRDDWENLFHLARSMEQQNYEPQRFEWIVVDDASKTEPPPWIDRYSPEFRFKLLRRNRHLGRAATRNEGARSARGSIVVFLDSDMMPTRSWLEMMARAVKLTNSVVVGKTDPSPSLKWTALIKYLHTRGTRKLAPGAKGPGKYFTTGNCAMPLELFRKSGGFDESLKGWGGEDLELGVRIEKLGESLFYESRAKCFHRSYAAWPVLERRYIDYGETVVPYLVKRHPNVEQLLSLTVFYNYNGNAHVCNRLKRNLIVWLVQSSLLYRALSWTVSRVPSFPWPSIIFDYLIFTIYSKHFRNKGVLS